jgi:transcriptional regulator with XRE-family HTH domain
MNWEYRPKIASLREANQLTQLELAQIVGVTETTIANWEKGRSGTEWIDRLIRLCAALKCTPEDLLTYIPQVGDEGAFSAIVRLIEEGRQQRSQASSEWSQDLSSESIEQIVEEGGKFSDIVKLIEAGHQAQAKRSVLHAIPAPIKGAAKNRADKRGVSKL